MEFHFTKIFTTLLFICFSKPAFSSDQCDFPGIINFGDSNSDTGGFSAAFGMVQWPQGESYFNGPAGRYSDGRLIIDFIAESLGLPYINSYLDSIGSNFSHGANFATAASTIRPQNLTLRQGGGSPISLDIQFNEFYSFNNRSQIFRQKGGVYEKLLPKADYISRALYTFDIGQNDLTSGFFQRKPIEDIKANTPDILGQFKNIVKYIYGLGGRYFWIHNTGPFGCLAYMLDNVPLTPSEMDKAGCGSPFNDVAQHFNRELKQLVVQLRAELPLAVITYVDIYSVKYSLFTQGKEHGFQEPLRVCCGNGGKYNYNAQIACGGKQIVNGTEILMGKPCKDPSKSVIWDGTHYTQAANKWIFDQIVGGSFSDPSVPLKFACHKK